MQFDGHKLAEAQLKAQEEMIDWAQKLRVNMSGKELDAFTSGFGQGWRMCLEAVQAQLKGN